MSTPQELARTAEQYDEEQWFVPWIRQPKELGSVLTIIVPSVVRFRQKSSKAVQVRRGKQ